MWLMLWTRRGVCGMTSGCCERRRGGSKVRSLMLRYLVASEVVAGVWDANRSLWWTNGQPVGLDQEDIAVIRGRAKSDLTLGGIEPPNP